MNSIEYEFALNSLDAVSRGVITEMYYHYSDTRESNSGIPLNEIPMPVVAVSPNWRTDESMDSVISRLLDTGLITRTGEGNKKSNQDILRFNQACVDGDVPVLDLIKKWTKTPSLTTLIHNVSWLEAQADDAREKLAKRLAYLIPDGSRVENMNTDSADSTLCLLTLDDGRILKFPIAVLNAADPALTYNAIQQASDSKMSVARVKPKSQF